jgi:hypothetical protein
MAASFASGSPRQPGTDPFLDLRALELGKHAQHLEHGRAGGRARVEALLVQEQVDPEPQPLQRRELQSDDRLIITTQEGRSITQAGLQIRHC